MPAVPLDPGGVPCAPCPACGGHAFHRAPGAAWACAGCHPPRLPAGAAGLAGWAFCALPPEPVARLLAAGRRAVAGVVGTSDEGELVAGGEP